MIDYSPLNKFRIFMIISRLLILLSAIILSSCQSGFNKNFATAIKTLRTSLSEVSLVGDWKFLQDSNFVINKKVTMINEAASQIMRNNDKLSFISSDSADREAEAYFEADRQGNEPKRLYIQLYNGKYYSNNTVALEIDLRQMDASHRADSNTNIWNTTKPIIVMCMLVRNKQVIAQISTHAKVQIYTNAKETDLINDNNRYYVKFQSSSLSFYLQLKRFTDQYDKFAEVYGVSTLLFAVLLFCFKPKKSMYNISQWMILHAFAFEIVSSWLFIRVSLQKIDTKLKFVGFCAFINICLSFFFLRNYEEVLKSFKGKFQRIASIIGLLSYFVMCYFFEESLTFWIFESFCLMALQINYSYSMGGRGGLSVPLVFTLLAMRAPYFFYRFASPQITRQPTDFKSLGIFMMVNAILFVFIIMQRYFGSRFMIPKELIPDYFNYYQKIDLNDEMLNETCPICTNTLKMQSALKQQTEQKEEVEMDESVNQQIPAQTATARNKTIMITPCDHKYHSSCLQLWMENRLICPYCRGVLPPSESQRDDSYCC